MRLFVLAVLSFSASAIAAEDASELLEPIRSKHGVPALAAAATRDGTLVALGATGVRKHGDSAAVTKEDRWHVGSCGKSMTASLAAVLVQEGKIRWDTTVGEAFPKWSSQMHASWKSVTLEQLLAHRGGAPEEPPGAVWLQAWEHKGSPAEQRLRFIEPLLRSETTAAPGGKFIYSNSGYAIAGAMLETITGTAWEELMRAKLFQPLGMNSAGFGAPGSVEARDQPQGHRSGRRGLQPMPPGLAADNPPSIAPAGTMHFSINDFARYAAWHAAEGKDAPQLLTAESFTKLHTPIGSESYALGWRVLKRTWAGGRTLTHAGSNTMWYAVMWIAPEKNLSLVAATNAATPGAEQACDDAVALLLERYLASSGAE